MNPNLKVTLSLALPNHGKVLCTEIQLSEFLFDESFRALPRNREIPWELEAGYKAAKQKNMRQIIARHMGEQLAHAMIELIESNDPQYGYSAEEWRQINS